MLVVFIYNKVPPVKKGLDNTSTTLVCNKLNTQLI